ncbi:hypothetical protein [Bacillus sp. D386]|uniref:hypothetical protein n=1 Tax=Bacillus sp. D386 TaxID=2587155 RepID=UPI0011238E7E|nr:hypothetical protein [Bacillus sp. D386]
MKSMKEIKARKRFVRDMTFLTILTVILFISSIGTYSSFVPLNYVYIAGWIKLVTVSLLTGYFIYLNEVAFKRANPIGWFMVILGMVYAAMGVIAMF